MLVSIRLALTLTLVCLGRSVEKSPPVPSIGPFAPGEYDKTFVSSILEYFDCNVRSSVAYVMRPDNPGAINFEHGNGPAENGGFGAQMVLQLVPAMTTAFLFGKRLAPNLARSRWNYGCPGHVTGGDVLSSLQPLCSSPMSGCTEAFPHIAVGGATEELAGKQPSCHGQRVPFSAIRNATADFLFTLTPYFAAGVASLIAKLHLPKQPFLAVHIRGGDKLVAEWTGPLGHLGKPEKWVPPILEAAAHERSEHSPDLSHRIFVASDDCALLLRVAEQLDLIVAPDGEKYSVIHFPCEVPPAVEYSQRGKSALVTGHHQQRFNSNHSCFDTVRFFAVLSIFRDAQAVLLGPGGVNGGYVRAPARSSSNTVLFIELLRGGRALKPAGRDYHVSGLLNQTSGGLSLLTT